ncbi:MAG: DNA gyrase subunit A, partial [Rhodospirillaceae bacterium]|nr:DNA gyrase subunit A [Rhodospirillaceae bacterium]
DLIQREDMVLTFTHGGYIKRVPLATYRAQKRGGKGRAGMKTKEEDFVDQVYVVNTHTPVLFFSSTGMVYKLKVYRLPLGTPQARGKAMVNMLPLQPGENISIILPLPDENEWPALDVMFATTSGTVRRNSLADFVNVMSNGKIAMKLEEGESLVGVKTCDAGQDVLLATAAGRAIRFPVADVRRFKGRGSRGVRGIRLTPDDRVISLSILNHVDAETDTRDEYIRIANAHKRAGSRIEQGEKPNREDVELAARIVEPPWSDMHAVEEFVLTASDDGLGKRTSAYEYRITGRGGGGIVNMDLDRDGSEARVVGAFPVEKEDELILVTNGGQIIRVPVDGISVVGRKTRGVNLFRLDDDERVVSVSRLRDANGAEESPVGAEAKPDGLSDRDEPDRPAAGGEENSIK